MDNQDRIRNIINHLNSLSFTNHFARFATMFAIIMVVFSFVTPITYHGMIDTVYFCIGTNILFHFITDLKIYYLKAALANTFVGLILAGSTYFN